MKTPIQRLIEMQFALDCANHPNIPVELMAKTKYKDKTANELTKAVIAWIKLNGGQAERINTMGRPIDQRKTYVDTVGYQRQIGSLKWIPSTSTRGSSDISAIVNGKSLKIEIKVGRDVQSAAQKEFQESVESAGGIYKIITSFAEFYNWWNDKIVR